MSPAAVEVWLIDLDDPHAPAGPTCGSPDERRRAVAWGAARRLLAAREGTTPERLRIRRSPFGRPELEGARGPRALRFSLTRSGGTALLAIARGRRVGVDVETLRPLAEPLALARRMLPPVEADALIALPPAARDAGVLAGWTRAEAYLKARGDGLHRAARLTLDATGGAPARVIAADGVPPEGDWRVADLDVAGHRAAVAAEGDGWEVRWRRPERAAAAAAIG